MNKTSSFFENKMIKTVAICSLRLASASMALARRRSSSGSFSGSGGRGGSFQHGVEASGGQRNTTTSWQNSRGSGESTSQAQWNKDTGTGTASRNTTYANGKTSSSQGSLTQNPDGSYSA